MRVRGAKLDTGACSTARKVENCVSSALVGDLERALRNKSVHVHYAAPDRKSAWALQPYISSKACSQDLSSVVAETHSSANDSTSRPRGPGSSILLAKSTGRETWRAAIALRRCNSAGTWEDLRSGRDKKTRCREPRALIRRAVARIRLC